MLHEVVRDVYLTCCKLRLSNYSGGAVEILLNTQLLLSILVVCTSGRDARHISTDPNSNFSSSAAQYHSRLPAAFKGICSTFRSIQIPLCSTFRLDDLDVGKESKLSCEGTPLLFALSAPLPDSSHTCSVLLIQPSGHSRFRCRYFNVELYRQGDVPVKSIRHTQIEKVVYLST